MKYLNQIVIGCKIWRLFFIKLWRLFKLAPMRPCMLRRPTKSFRLAMRFAVEGVDPMRPWIRKAYDK